MQVFIDDHKPSQCPWCHAWLDWKIANDDISRKEQECIKLFLSLDDAVEIAVREFDADVDKYRKDMQESREFNFFATLDFQQTIIEADKEE